MSDPEDLIVWPCGTTCFRHELHEFTHLSDDYEVVAFGTPQHQSLSHALDALDTEEFKAWHAPEHLAYVDSLCAPGFSGA